MICIFLLGILAFEFTNSSYAETWYPGEGLKQGDYFRYNVCSIDYHKCTPLEIDFWVKNQTRDGTGWNLEFLAIDGVIVQKGTVTIGMIAADPKYSDPSLSDYTSVYENTIAWLNSVTTKHLPKDFRNPMWGSSGFWCVPSFGPIGQDKVTVKAGTFDTWKIGWHAGGDSTIWVAPNLPFPVKGVIYNGCLGMPGILLVFDLELLETGNILTEPQFLHRPIVNPPFSMPQKTTGSDTVSVGTGTMCGDGMPMGFNTLVEVSTNPPRPVRGQPLLVSMTFSDFYTGIDVAGQNYSITVTQDGKTILSNSTARSVNNGHDIQTTGILESSDPVEIKIHLGSRSENSHMRCDHPSTLTFRVVPESNTLAVPFDLAVNRTFYYVVKVSTNPPSPLSGQPMSISVKFTDYTGAKTPNEHYAITVTQDGKTVFSNSTAYTNTGFDTQTTGSLESSDPVDINIALGYTPVFLTFHVIPEFPFAMVVLIIGIIVTLVITRIKWNQISSFSK